MVLDCGRRYCRGLWEEIWLGTLGGDMVGDCGVQCHSKTAEQRPGCSSVAAISVRTTTIRTKKIRKYIFDFFLLFTLEKKYV